MGPTEHGDRPDPTAAGRTGDGDARHRHQLNRPPPYEATRHTPAEEPSDAIPSQRQDSALQDAAAQELWTRSMHLQVVQAQPGQCGICHMQLVPPGPWRTP